MHQFSHVTQGKVMDTKWNSHSGTQSSILGFGCVLVPVSRTSFGSCVKNRFCFLCQEPILVPVSRTSFNYFISSTHLLSKQQFITFSDRIRAIIFCVTANRILHPVSMQLNIDCTKWNWKSILQLPLQ